jgi:hypothetical protein
MTRRAGCVLVVVVAAAASALVRAQEPRDVSPPRSGTARISGLVLTTDDTPQPVRRAVVSLSALHSGDTALGHHAMTDDEGRFAFEGLIEGRYNISAARASFVTIPYGATMPQRTAAPIVLARGETVADVRVLLARGAVITGTIRDSTGDVVAGLDVRVEPMESTGGGALIAKTSDQGLYRFFGLAAGTYVVSARPPRTPRAELTVPTDAQVDEALRELRSRGSAAPAGPVRPAVGNIPSGTAPASVQRADFVPVFHPSTFIRTNAGAIVVRPGEERAGVDILLRMTSTAVVAGQILDAGNHAPADVEIWLSKAGTAAVASSERTIMRSDGTFRLAGVMPGRYLVAVRAVAGGAYQTSATATTSAPRSANNCAFAAESVDVSGADVTGLLLRLRPCLRISGHVAFSPSATLKAPSLSSMRVMLEADRAPDAPAFVPPRAPAVVGPDGRFTLGELGDVFPGRFRVKVDLPGLEPGRGWWLESATAAGRDILDAPLEITAAGAPIIEIVFTFSDKHTALSGALETGSRRQPHEYMVIAFPTNRDWWRTSSRRVRTARPDFKGQYQMQDLPPGEYYLAALTDLAPDDLRDPDFLGSIASSGIRVTIGVGEQKIQNIRLALPASGR